MMFDHDPAAQDRRGRQISSPIGDRNPTNAVLGSRQMSTLPSSRTARYLFAMLAALIMMSGLPGPTSARAATDESNRYLERAQGYLSKGELQSAIIELKNSVRADPDN